MRTKSEKRDAKSRNIAAAFKLANSLQAFSKQLRSKDIECLDEDYKQSLVNLRQSMLQNLLILSPIADEGIKSLAAQSVSGRLAAKG